MSKSKIAIVIRREYATRVHKKSFFVMTILMPILFVAFLTVPIIIGKTSVSETKIAVLDATGLYTNLFENTKAYTFVPTQQSLEELKALGKDNEEGYAAVLEIRSDLLQDPTAITLYGYKQIPPGVAEHINDVLSPYLSQKKLEASEVEGITEIVANSKVEINVPTFKWAADGEEERSSGNIASIIGMILAGVSFFFITTFGSLVMGSVLEEKKNRIMEVMVSSVRPFDMMMGKIIALGLVGITQIVLWVALTGILLTAFSSLMAGNLQSIASLASMQQSDMTGLGAGLNPDSFSEIQMGIGALMGINFGELLLMFLLYFVGGYLLYASLFAAVGAAISSEEDSNQFITPVMLLLMFAFYAGFGSMRNPDGPLALWCSLIPFTSPIVMMIRLPYDVPVWQQILSIVILFATFGGITWLSAKIYRVGILMYGKKPSWRELRRWIRYK